MSDIARYCRLLRLWHLPAPCVVTSLADAMLANLSCAFFLPLRCCCPRSNQYGSDAMVNELERSQNIFFTPLLETLKKLMALIPQTSDAASLKLLMSTLRLVCRIFFSLNAPGLTPVSAMMSVMWDFSTLKLILVEQHLQSVQPADGRRLRACALLQTVFLLAAWCTQLVEGQLDSWMGEFHMLLAYESPLLAEKDTEKESALDAVKSAVCQVWCRQTTGLLLERRRFSL